MQPIVDKAAASLKRPLEDATNVAVDVANKVLDGAIDAATAVIDFAASNGNSGQVEPAAKRVKVDEPAQTGPAPRVRGVAPVKAE